MGQTNYIDKLDPALLRPGRIDRKIQYKLATKRQAAHLFTRFFPESRFGQSAAKPANEKFPEQVTDEKYDLVKLASQFGAAIPEDEFSTAELQGFLLSCKMKPAEAVDGIHAWVEEERLDRLERAERERKRSQKLREAKAKREAKQRESSGHREPWSTDGALPSSQFSGLIARSDDTPDISSKHITNGIVNGI
jgi:mitochondrial chaperone BCS1